MSLTENLEQPKIDIKAIQKAANEAAEKAYLKEISEYYTSYSSPYREMIQNELNKQKFSYGMELPNIMSKINEALIKEVDIIANNAIASSYIPMVSNALIGLDKEITLSYLLKEIIIELEPDRNEFDDFSFHFEEDREYNWLNCFLSTPKSEYEFTLHTATTKEGEQQKYKLLSFPSNKSKKGYNSNMIVYKDDVKIEMPFTPNILEDKVLNLFFKMMLSGSKITMDCKEFDDDMFPEQEFCHC